MKFKIIATVLFMIVMAVAVFIYSQQQSSGPVHRASASDNAFATLKAQ